MLNNLLEMNLKLLQKEQNKKKQKQPVISLVTTLLIKLQKLQEVRSKTIQSEIKK